MTPAVLLTFILVVVAASGRLTLAKSSIRRDSAGHLQIRCAKDPSQPAVTITGITDVAGAGQFEVCCSKNKKKCRRPRPWKPARVISQNANSVTVSTEKCRRKRIAQAVRWACHDIFCQGCILEGEAPPPTTTETPARR